MLSLDLQDCLQRYDFMALPPVGREVYHFLAAETVVH